MAAAVPNTSAREAQSVAMSPPFPFSWLLVNMTSQPH
jgi:hypothetical protein